MRVPTCLASTVLLLIHGESVGENGRSSCGARVFVAVVVCDNLIDEWPTDIDYTFSGKVTIHPVLNCAKKRPQRICRP